ncbi:efflux RND transporter periplasmic adaptor subunit (plasmid) [Bernardetia sp. Wsw4-3y2]|uniref:efflux RND transporter periplasmic adaptor subunit n=1 Tax=unclassified Bernardetia TaxID=2647129 RepID=UPI0030D3E6FA
MKKYSNKISYLFFFVAILSLSFLSSCGEKEPKTPEEKKAALEKKRSELMELQGEIAQLEDALGEAAKKENPSKLVESMPVKSETFNHYIEVQGTVESDKNVTILPEMPATIMSLKVKEGDRVSAGQVIATLDAGTFNKQVAELETQLSLATTVYEKRKRLWEQKIGSEIEYLQSQNQKESLENSIATLKQQMRKSVVTSPISGTIDEVYAKQGELANPAMPIARVINVSDVQLVADVSENYLSAVKKGDKVKIFFSALGTEMEQKVTFVGQTINTANRTFKVQIDLPNKNGAIKPNLVGTVKINDFQAEGAITVPTNLIQIGTDGSKFLYVVKEEAGKKVAKKVVVKTGMSYEGSTVVTEGLSANDQVIIKGYNEVVDGENVRFIKS